jgi:hypothetical protein
MELHPVLPNEILNLRKFSCFLIGIDVFFLIDLIDSSNPRGIAVHEWLQSSNSPSKDLRKNAPLRGWRVAVQCGSAEL